MMPMQKIEELSKLFEQGLTGPDAGILEKILAPNFEIWYNFTDSSLGRCDALSFFASYFSKVQVRFRDVRLLPTAEGWLQQHRVDAKGEDGFRIDGLPAAVVFTVENDLIVRIEEYFDSAQAAGFDKSQMNPNKDANSA